jgi:hypothetical protein
MDIIDITHWASPEIKVVDISHVYTYIPYRAELREFVPVEGDMTTEMWTDKYGIVKQIKVPAYAIADMNKHAQMTQKFIDDSIHLYIGGTIGHLNQFFQETYKVAYDHLAHTKVEEDSQITHVSMLTIRRNQSSSDS